MSTPKKAAPKAAPAADTPALRKYPAAEEFTEELLKTLRTEFDALLASKSNPERTEELRALGKAAQTFLKAKRAAATAPKAESKPTLTLPELSALAEEMNEVMSLVPPLVPGNEDLLDRVMAELKDLHLDDFHPNADHPEKKIFTDGAKDAIRKLGVAIPGEGKDKKPAAPKAAGKKEFPSARQIIYKAWMAGEKDVDKLVALVNESVKKDTIRTYLSDWGKGKYLPAGVVAPKIKDGKAVTK